jgi:Pyridoxamine 5'-phosphate oxidase
MPELFASMTPAHREFIARQRVFFTASATATSRVNVSPRPTDALCVLDGATVAYLDRTGSGSETAAHLRVDGRITLMFCAFDEPPSILRLYGCGTSLPRNSADYAVLLATVFDNQEPLGARQIVRINVDLVQTSCGYGVPLFEYIGERSIHCTDGQSRRATKDSKRIAFRRTHTASTDCRLVWLKRRPHLHRPLRIAEAA